MSLFEIKIEIPVDAVDRAEEVLLELGLEGWSLLQDALAGRAWVVGIFPSEAEAASRREELRPLLPSAGTPVQRPLADRDWRDSYKAHFKAWTFGRLHWVPVWEQASFVCPPGDAVLWLDPGLAFGTGNHETTRLCVERLVTWLGERSRTAEAASSLRLIDAGCGSGILALSAARLGVEDVVGFDNDPEAVRVSEENARLNGLAGRVPFLVADLEAGLAGREADLVLANIQADILMRFAALLVGAIAPGGSLVLSGILAEEADRVRETFAALTPNWRVESRRLGEWVDLALTRD